MMIMMMELQYRLVMMMMIDGGIYDMMIIEVRTLNTYYYILQTIRFRSLMIGLLRGDDYDGITI